MKKKNTLFDAKVLKLLARGGLKLKVRQSCCIGKPLPTASQFWIHQGLRRGGDTHSLV